MPREGDAALQRRRAARNKSDCVRLGLDNTCSPAFWLFANKEYVRAKRLSKRLDLHIAKSLANMSFPWDEDTIDIIAVNCMTPMHYATFRHRSLHVKLAILLKCNPAVQIALDVHGL
jgi:hypothetical protein